MELATQIAAILHLIAAMYWTGALLFLALVASPILELVRPPSFQRQLARRFWMVTHRSMWVAIGLLVFSGVFMLFRRGMLNASMLSMDFLLSPAGKKIGITVVMVFLSLLHDLFLGPGARLKDPKASTDPPGMISRVIPFLLAAGAISATLIALQLRE